VIRVLQAGPTLAALLVGVFLTGRLVIQLWSGQALNHVSGVWLALAQDTGDGIFYRALSESGEYGGTRYFPLLFLVIAAFMRAGFEPVTAGHSAVIISTAVLVSGIFAALLSLGVRRVHAAVGVALAMAPYFVQQSIESIRAEPLAAGLVMWGAAGVGRRIRGIDDRPWAATAAGCFALAFAAKPTAVYGGLAAVLALAGAGRRSDARRIAVLCVALWCSVLLVIHVLSDGRATESFRACALAGGSVAQVLTPHNLLASLSRLLASRLITAMLTVSMATSFIARGWPELPTWLLAGATGASVITLGTEGTILANQIVEPHIAAAVFLTWGLSRAFKGASPLVLSGFLAWAAAQNARDLQGQWKTAAPQDVRIRRSAAIAAASRCPVPWLSESPLLPVLGGRRPLLLDPFALRVASLRHPELTLDLVQRIQRREFGCVVLEYDPATEGGRGWYRNVHFGLPVIDAVTTHYRFNESVGGYRFYVRPEDGD
jgi:hypothetical protein